MLICALSFKTSSRDPHRPKQLPLAPGSKYLLVRFAQYFGKEICTLSLRELAKQFGISDQRASDALLELTREGCLDRSSMPVDRGRPRNHYRLTEAICAQIEQARTSKVIYGVPHVAAIERLIAHESSGAILEGQCMEKPNALPGRQPRRLSTVDRLLLSVLLCHADQFGAVYDLSFADLYQLTGIKPDVTKSKVHRLLDLGFIRSYVPGATSQTMFGKVKSTYVLNLQSSESYGCLPLFLLIDLCNGGKSSGLDNEAKMLFLECASASVKKDPTWEGSIETQLFAQIGGFFRQEESRMVLPILQHRLELYASLMLTECWSLLPVRAPDVQSPKADFMPVLREHIAKDFQPPGKIHCEGEGFPTKKQHDMLIDQLFVNAFRIACQIKQDFSGVNAIGLQGMKCLLLPRYVHWFKDSTCLQYRSMLVVPKNSTAASGCYLMSDQRDLLRIECEPVLPVGTRYLAALMALRKTNAQDKGA